jgi:hypothetical protein
MIKHKLIVSVVVVAVVVVVLLNSITAQAEHWTVIYTFPF